MTTNSDDIQDRIKTIVNLPTLPHIVTRLMGIVDSPDTSAASVAALVSQDVSLSAKVLRLANSAFYGVPRGVNTLTNAVVILGFRVVQTMVLSLTVFDMFSRGGGKDPLFDRDEFWRHSLRCAVTSRLIAQRRADGFATYPEEAFCGGLLHDIGKIVMEQYLNADFHKALRYARSCGTDSFDAERQVLGYTHCDVGRWLTESWSLPDRIALPIALHHEPGAAGAGACADSVMICHIANAVSNVRNVSELDRIAETLSVKAQIIGLSAKDLDEVIAAIPKETERATMFITH